MGTPIPRIIQQIIVANSARNGLISAKEAITGVIFDAKLVAVTTAAIIPAMAQATPTLTALCALDSKALKIFPGVILESFEIKLTTTQATMPNKTADAIFVSPPIIATRKNIAVGMMGQIKVVKSLALLSRTIFLKYLTPISLGKRLIIIADIIAIQADIPAL